MAGSPSHPFAATFEQCPRMFCVLAGFPAGLAAAPIRFQESQKAFSGEVEGVTSRGLRIVGRGHARTLKGALKFASLQHGAKLI